MTDMPTSSVEEKSPPSAPAKSAGAVWISFFALIFSIFALAIVMAMFLGMIPSKDTVRVTNLEKNLILSRASPSATEWQAPFEDMNQRLSDLSARLQQVQQPKPEQPSPVAMPATPLSPETISLIFTKLDALEKRVGAWESTLATLKQAGVQSQVFVLAAIQLQSALDAGRPYAFALNTLGSLSGKDANSKAILETLRPTAANGVTTIENLKKMFAVATQHTLHEPSPESTSNWFGRIWQRLQNIVVIRPIGLVEGNDVSAIIARVEYHLKQNNVGQALTEMERLPGPVSESVFTWLTYAKQYQQAHQALDALMALAIRRLGGAP